jgi:hypothetical protein
MGPTNLSTIWTSSVLKGAAFFVDLFQKYKPTSVPNAPKKVIPE